MEYSHIQWTHHTFNPWFGCTEVSPECAACYARVLMAERLKRCEWGRGAARGRLRGRHLEPRSRSISAATSRASLT